MYLFILIWHANHTAFYSSIPKSADMHRKGLLYAKQYFFYMKYNGLYVHVCHWYIHLILYTHFFNISSRICVKSLCIIVMSSVNWQKIYIAQNMMSSYLSKWLKNCREIPINVKSPLNNARRLHMLSMFSLIKKCNL